MTPSDVVRKLVPFDRATLREVLQLADDQMKDLQEVTEEAFRDLLRKYGRSADLKQALQLSTRKADDRHFPGVEGRRRSRRLTRTD